MGKRRVAVRTWAGVLLALLLALTLGAPVATPAAHAAPGSGVAATSGGDGTTSAAERRAPRKKAKKSKAAKKKKAGQKGKATSKKKAAQKKKGKKPKKKRKPRKRGSQLPPLYVDTHSHAWHAAERDPTFKPIASRPQAFWIVGEYGVGGVEAAVARYVERARRAQRTPVLALYAIPYRDCGGHSAGGIGSETTYRAFVQAAARAVRGGPSIVVIEPDAVPNLPAAGCGDPVARARMLRFAVSAFARAGAWTYLDGGHARWHDAATTARLLLQSGVRQARGFSLNVSNFGATGQQVRYGNEVNAQLRAAGVTGRTFVVDTSRNGAATPPAPEDWCNPPTARIGRGPAIVRQGQLDGYLWVKRPGESDGACNGGPSAGWWPDGARRLLSR